MWNTVEEDFYKRVVDYLCKASNSTPYDEYLLGISLVDADVINANDTIIRLARTDRNLQGMTFQNINDAFVPITSDNVFIQFQMITHFQKLTNVTKRSSSNWMGVHVLPLHSIENSRLILHLGPLPKKVRAWPSCIVILFYQEINAQVYLGVNGMFVGIDLNGHVIRVEPFCILGGSISNELQDFYEKGITNSLWLTYLTLSLFALVNQGETLIKYVEPKRWEVV